MSLSAFPGSGAPARLVSIGLPQGQGSGTIPLLYRRSGLLARNNFLSTLGILLCTRAASSFLAPAASRQLLQTRIASSRNLAAPTMIVVPAPSPLPDLGSGGFSISTFNVLLPNSIDGWWIYKYYQPHVPAEHREWPYRQQLCRSKIEEASSDIVCLQECAEQSFEDDWSFMKEAGYSFALHSKLRFRTATFWRDSKFELISQHDKDRTLVAALKFKESGATVYVCNCHLSAGPSPDKRLRQLHDSVEQVRKEASKVAGSGGKGGKGASSPPLPTVVVCGDFNSDGYSGVTELLTKGEVPGGYVEAAYPSVEMSSKAKKHALGPMADSREVVYAGLGQRKPPSTFIAPMLDEFMIKEKEGGEFDLTELLVDALRRAFEELSGGKGHMDAADVDAWLIKINKHLGRGSEFRSASRLVNARGEGKLLFEDFVEVYRSELGEGKFWGVEYDLVQAIGTPLDKPARESFQSTFDYIFYTTSTLEVECVRESITEEERNKASSSDPFPNSWQPSDHLMQSAAFRFSAGSHQ